MSRPTSGPGAPFWGSRIVKGPGGGRLHQSARWRCFGPVGLRGQRGGEVRPTKIVGGGGRPRLRVVGRLSTDGILAHAAKWCTARRCQGATTSWCSEPQIPAARCAGFTSRAGNAVGCCALPISSARGSWPPSVARLTYAVQLVTMGQPTRGFRQRRLFASNAYRDYLEVTRVSAIQLTEGAGQYWRRSVRSPSSPRDR